MMNGIAASGATWVRLGASWSQAEQTSDTYTWSYSDNPVNAALAAGLNVLFVINGSDIPSWAASPSSSLNTFTSQYAAFAQAAVQRYSMSPFNIHTYEVWNEPNLGSNWGGTASGTQYATVLKSAYGVIKAADASSFVISGGLSPASNDGTDVSPQTFLTEMYAAGAGGYFDAVGVHPYCFPANPTDSSSASWSFFYNLPNWIYQVMVTNGDGAKKVWMTEFGDPTGTDTSGGAVSLQTQAQQLTDAFNALKQWSWAGPLFWYNWQDGTDPTSIYDNFGLIDASSNAKPALSAFEAEAQSLNTSSSDLPSVPTAPASLAATVSDSTVTLSWVNPSGAQGDNVYRDGMKIASLGLVTSYQDANVASGSHGYRVSAYNSTGQGPASNFVTVTVTSVPAAPTNLGDAVSGSTVTLSWVNPSGAQGDNIYRNGTKIASPRLVTSYQDLNVASGLHTYYITAYNAVGASAPSASVTMSCVTRKMHHTLLFRLILG
jgi:hypothetical protein